MTGQNRYQTTSWCQRCGMPGHRAETCNTASDLVKAEECDKAISGTEPALKPFRWAETANLFSMTRLGQKDQRRTSSRTALCLRFLMDHGAMWQSDLMAEYKRLGGSKVTGYAFAFSKFETPEAKLVGGQWYIPPNWKPVIDRENRQRCQSPRKSSGMIQTVAKYLTWVGAPSREEHLASMTYIELERAHGILENDGTSCRDTPDEARHWSWLESVVKAMRTK